MTKTQTKYKSKADELQRHLVSEAMKHERLAKAKLETIRVEIEGDQNDDDQHRRTRTLMTLGDLSARADGHRAAATMIKTCVRVASKRAADYEGDDLDRDIDLVIGRPLYRFVIDKLTVGADDSWSGRSNDHRRVVHDVIRDAVSDVMSIWDSVTG